MSEHYGHDLWGALSRGYTRRSREAAFKLLTEVRGRMDPMRISLERPGVTFGMALHTLIQCAERKGIDTRVIRDCIIREAENWDKDFGGHEPLQGDAYIQFDENMCGLREDPVESGGLDWDAYDEHVDGMTTDELKRTLKEEARLRKQAQTEAAELRNEP